MIKMKKILGILLAVCFLVSITAAAASAGSERGYKHNEGFGDHDHREKFEGHGYRHFHPGHWDHHRVGHREFFEDCGCWKTVYVVEKFFVNEYWGFN